MRRALRLVWSAVLYPMLFLPGCASAPRAARPTVTQQPRRPSLDVYVSPRFVFGPANVFLHAELDGGRDEDFHCAKVRWDFGDDSVGEREGDCDPWTPQTEINRAWSAVHCYHAAGDFPVLVTLSKADRKLAVGHATVTVLWRPGSGSC